VAVTPGRDFGHAHTARYVRFSTASSMAQLQEAASGGRLGMNCWHERYRSPSSGCRVPVRVYWEDTDAGGIVFYANYLKFFERARTEWLRSLGVRPAGAARADRRHVRGQPTNVRYHRPARLDDELMVTARLQEAGRASHDNRQQARLRPAARASAVRGHHPHRLGRCRHAAACENSPPILEALQMNQDLSILHLVLHASLVVQLVMLLLLVVSRSPAGRPSSASCSRSSASSRSTTSSSASSGPAPA
jgi:acyl-CoA thioester hydrolase